MVILALMDASNFWNVSLTAAVDNSRLVTRWTVDREMTVSGLHVSVHEAIPFHGHKIGTAIMDIMEINLTQNIGQN